jgi:hypothetical protein
MAIVTLEEGAYFEDVTRRYACGANLAALSFAEAHETKCHQNADAFFVSHPDHPAVRGWLITELGGALGYFRLAAHSVNRSPNGTFVDVTPLSEADRKAYRFVEHEGPKETFNRLKAKFPEIYFPIIDTLAMSAL